MAASVSLRLEAMSDERFLRSWAAPSLESGTRIFVCPATRIVRRLRLQIWAADRDLPGVRRLDLQRRRRPLTLRERTFSPQSVISIGTFALVRRAVLAGEDRVQRERLRAQVRARRERRVRARRQVELEARDRHVRDGAEGRREAAVGGRRAAQVDIHALARSSGSGARAASCRCRVRRGRPCPSAARSEPA